jgi:hypothetical protein
MFIKICVARVPGFEHKTEAKQVVAGIYMTCPWIAVLRPIAETVYVWTIYLSTAFIVVSTAAP